MLSVLKIQNIAIIESAEIDFSRGFNVLTGETGAGKSIILDSINAVLGFRTSRELIRTGETKAEVSALFTCVGQSVTEKLSALGFPTSDDGSVAISRTITADKNICRVNGSVTNVSVLRELGAELISIHGQLDNRELLDEQTHLSYIDKVAQCDGLFADFFEKFAEYTRVKNALKKLNESKEALARKADILSYQINELESAEIKLGEWDELKQRLSVIQNFKKIQSALANASAALDGDASFSGARELTSGAFKEIKAVADCSEELMGLSSRMGELYYELDDIASTLGSMLDGEGFSQGEADEVGDRLDLLRRLSKKYGATEAEMLEFLESAKAELEEIDVSDERVDELKRLESECKALALEAAKKLSVKRKSAADEFCEKVCEELEFLDMQNVRFLAQFSEIPMCETGIDGVVLLISANVGEEPKSISKIASGGELSRIMLAFKTVFANRDSVETMIFDEIDTGVSGRAAHKVALKLSELSRGRQVLCVTHLAQMASFADDHYLIEKNAVEGKTYTSVTVLDRDGRKNELARLTGSGTVTSLQLENAEEMLKSAEKEKSK